MFQVKVNCSWFLARDVPQELDGPLFPLLQAIRDSGSLGKAAKQIGTSYRYAWGLVGKWQHLLGQPLVLKERGRGARLAPLGESLLWAEQRLRARLAPQLESFSAEMQRELAGVFCAARPTVSVCASHDLALAGLRDLLAQQPGVQLDLEFRGSLDSLQALGAGTCDLAGFHVAEYHGRGTLSHLAFRRWLKPRVHRLVDFVTRQQGLVVASGNPKRIRTLADLAQPGVRFVNRQRGSGTRLQFDQLLWEAGLDKYSIEGYQNEEFTHLAVAATIGGGQADAGYGIKAAAARYGLDFIPLVNERYFLVCRCESLEEPTVQQLLDTLKGTAFRSLVAGLAGYDASRAGEVLTVREALPWYDRASAVERDDAADHPEAVAPSHRSPV
ncbi:MAG: substrate-binding domain-containing protein [Burkholderiales bacterium]